LYSDAFLVVKDLAEIGSVIGDRISGSRIGVDCIGCVDGAVLAVDGNQKPQDGGDNGVEGTHDAYKFLRCVVETTKTGVKKTMMLRDEDRRMARDEVLYPYQPPVSC
jgi:hypothetical protein